MGKEIERKFLVSGEEWRQGTGSQIRQGYLAASDSCQVRVRLAGDHGLLTVKSRSEGPTRAEYEYEIPADEAGRMLEDLCDSVIEKRRYEFAYGGHTWEVDEFQADNRGLVLAEIELSAPDESFEKPPWLGEEVTEDARYYNEYLADHPWPEWG